MTVCDRCKDLNKPVSETYIQLSTDHAIHLCRECNEITGRVMHQVFDIVFPGPEPEIDDGRKRD